MTTPKDLPRNNLCNLLVIGILICYLDTENRDLHSDTCITYSVASPMKKGNEIFHLVNLKNIDYYRMNMEKKLRKLLKKDSVMYFAIINKIEEVRLNPERYKNLNAPKNNLKRVHVGSYTFLD